MNIVADLANGSSVGIADNSPSLTDYRELQSSQETCAFHDGNGGLFGPAIGNVVRKLSSKSGLDQLFFDMVDQSIRTSFPRGCTGSSETEADNV
jgi:hypothetical protein